MDDENISSEDIFDAIYLHQDVKLFPSTNERYGIQYQGKYLSEWDKNVYRNKITYLRLNEIPLYIHAGLKIIISLHLYSLFLLMDQVQLEVG